jgi:hypothetical protein
VFIPWVQTSGNITWFYGMVFPGCAMKKITKKISFTLSCEADSNDID